uniref:Ion transport domain-containing protein n=1 Tax=Periophthalmus magnuspinnatus TaxID=409849 RepID=A0A3B4A594_9GOBI
YQLAEKGDLAVLESQVRKSPEVLREKDELGAGPLHHAAAGGHVALIQFIMSVDSELNSSDEQGNVPLHWAVEKNQAESCKVLMDLGSDPNILNKALLAPLHVAVSKGHNNLIELFMSYNATDCNLQGDLGNTPLILASSLNNAEALSILIKNGARLCQQNRLGHFPVHAAAFAGSKKAMEVILKAEEIGYGPVKQINYLDKSNSSPLHLAVRGGNLETIQLCISTGAKVDQQQATIFDHTELAEYLISLGADLNSVDCKGNTPLLLATSCGSWRTVALLLSKACVSVKDRRGCNFLHLAILQPKGMKNLAEEVLQVKSLLNCEDNEGCTPLHYACRLGIHDSVKNMLGLSGQSGLEYKSKDKKSALHFAAYGRLNTCQRLLENIKDSRLLNEGDERGHTPLHLASAGGHTKVVQLLLRKGALFHDYKDWSCLHHAASEGYTQTMEILLSANIKLLDKSDEDGNTALHIAAREGHVAATKLLLARGAEILLNKNETSFMHEAIQNLRKDVVNAVIDSNCAEALTIFIPGGIQHCPVLDMIEYLPECSKHLLDSCVKESDHDPNSPEFHQIKYDFRWLQAPIEARAEQSMPHIGPLASLNSMVKHNRIELLNHPVCKKYLAMKRVAYGSIAHVLNMFFYLLGLLPLTHLIVALRPTYNITDTGERVITMVPISFYEQQSVFLSICMAMVVVMNTYSICKEVVQISQQRFSYFKDTSNQIDWFSALSSLGFVIPLMLNAQGSFHWQVGAVAVLSSWVGFLLYLQFEDVGIYVVMFGEIMKTLVRIVMVFLYLVLAFGLVFHALMLNQKQFESVPLSIVQTFVMMVGELNYQNNFLDSYLKDELPFDILTYLIFISFILLMPILLVNLMIGLAVGDIAEVQRNAALKRIAMQIDLHTSLEDKLPYWFVKRVDKPSTTIYPMKEMTSHLEKQHNLLKLIIQKMEISAEADEYDGPVHLKGSLWPALSQSKPKTQTVSRWVPLLKAIEARKNN